jgi:hypothetical protein
LIPDQEYLKKIADRLEPLFSGQFETGVYPDEVRHSTYSYSAYSFIHSFFHSFVPSIEQRHFGGQHSGIGVKD